MPFLALALAQVALIQDPSPGPELDANPLYRAVLAEGLEVEGVKVKLLAPCLREGMNEAEQRATLKATVDLPLDEFLRDSPTAPFKIKLRDVTYPGGVVRVVDLWFAIHAGLDEINLDELAGKKDQSGKEVGDEVANMNFSGRTLTDDELRARSIPVGDGLDRHALSRGVLLDRVKVSSVNHIVASKTPGALVIASKTDPIFDKDGDVSNRWSLLPVPGESRKTETPPRPYAGSAGYSRISPVSINPPVLLIESHLAFAEPKPWFNGTAILRAKLSLVAQDQIRKLRREVAARRKKEAQAPPAAKQP